MFYFNIYQNSMGQHVMGACSTIPITNPYAYPNIKLLYRIKVTLK